MKLGSLISGVLLAALTSTLAFAQSGPPGEDHYLVYKVLNPPTFSVPVVLSDQFIPGANYVTFTLDYFMTPVNKNGEGINDPVTHYTWWRISTYPFAAYAIISNQFGNVQPVSVFQPRYLLNPAIKTLPFYPPYTGPPPVKNHYVAYDADGPPLGVVVDLVDQFGPLPAEVDQMVYLAPPAQKLFQGQVYPILDPVNHLAFYLISPLQELPPPPPIYATDEFGVWQLVLGPRVMLGVPSLKSGVVGTKRDTWGRVKSLYR
ncbi:MAG: hypothetical protein ACHQ52_11040 [Candidatus Eisenbacteria bacterium]